MRDQISTISQISAAVSSFVTIYNHVDILLNELKFKEPAAMELQADLSFLPRLIMETLPSLNTGNIYHDRNFYRVLKLMCKALEEARDTLDEYMISVVVSLLHTGSFNLRLAESRSRIKHAVSLYNTYCNKGTPLWINSVMPMTSITTVDEDLVNMWECLNKLEQDKIGFEPIQGPCPKRILKVVAKLRSKKVGTEEVHKWGREEMDQFCRAGGLDALVCLLHSSNSESLQTQALKFLGIISDKNANMKKKIINIKHDVNNSDNPNALEMIGSLIALSGGGDLVHEAVALLRSLMRNNGESIVRRACQPGALASLFRTLACSSCNVQVQENVLGILWEFSALDEMNYRIANAIVNEDVLFKRLVGFCGCSCSCSSPVIEFCAAALLQNLCMNEDMRSKVSSTEGIAESLLYLMESFDMPSRIKALESSKNCNTPMVTGWCVSMLDCGFETYKIRGLDLLLGFSQSIVFLKLAAHEGAISRLVKLLDSGSTTVLEKAIEALYMLSMAEENEVRITSHDMAIQRLTALLESDSSSVRGNSVKALDSLSFNQTNKEKILEQNRALEKVAALLFHESPAGQSSACSLLWNLSNTTTANKIKISCIHGVPQRLSDLLLSDSPLVQEKAAGAIMSLSYNGRSRKMMASADCLFERLIKLLESVSTLVHQNAAGALYNLSISPQNIAAIGAHPRSVANLVTLLSSKGGLVQEYVAGALGNLALFEEIREEMKQKGAMPLLKKLKNNSSSIPVKTQAKRALDNLMV